MKFNRFQTKKSKSAVCYKTMMRFVAYCQNFEFFKTFFVEGVDKS